MVSQADRHCTPPKLSLLISRPSKPLEMPTPPLHATVSVPFQWEEVPGKPRHCPNQSKPKTARTLELPPRLLFSEAKLSNLPSPTTVLDGPYVGRAMSFTSSQRSPRGVVKDYWNSNFGSRRWSSFRKNYGEDVDGNFDFSNRSPDGTTKVKITRIRRRGSFFGTISHTKSHLWASIYDSFKYVVPWRRRQEKQR